MKDIILIIFLFSISFVSSIKIQKLVGNTGNTGNTPFLMRVETFSAMPGNGVILSGHVERGQIKSGDAIEIVGIRQTISTVVADVQGFKLKDSDWTGKDLSVLIKKIKIEEIESGMAIATPKSIKAYTKFGAVAEFLTAKQGGRKTPFVKGYKPLFNFKTATDFTGQINSIQSEDSLQLDMVQPGDKVQISVTLLTPVALEEGTEFYIKEKNITIGMGKILKVVS